MQPGINKIARGAIVAAVYVILNYLLLPVSFGIIQFRVAEALVVLPILYPEAIAGVFVGCLLSNVIGGLGLWDIFGGSAVTLLAAWLTHRYRNSIVAYLSPVVLNAFLISLYLSRIFGVPYWMTVFSIAAGEAGVIFLLGLPLVRYLRRYEARNGNRLG